MGMKGNGFVRTVWALRFEYVLGEEGGVWWVLLHHLWIFADSGPAVVRMLRVGCLKVGGLGVSGWGSLRSCGAFGISLGVTTGFALVPSLLL